MPKQPGVYALSNTVTNRAYVGSACDLSNRRSSHFWQLRNHRHKNHLIQSDFDQYGANSFEFTVLHHVPVAEGRRIEQRHIDSGEYSYNIAPKAAGGGNHTAQSAAKRSKTATGRKHAPETVEKLRNRPAETNGAFSGYFLTPAGRHASSYDAAEAMGNVLNFTTIRRWCKNPQKTVCAASYRKSAYLRSLGEGVIGRTFGELGFGFEPVPKL